MPIWLLLLLGGGGAYYAYTHVGTYGGPASAGGATQADTVRAVHIALAKETNAQNLQGFAAALLPYNAALAAQLSQRAAFLQSGSKMVQQKPQVQVQLSPTSGVRKPAMHTGV